MPVAYAKEILRMPLNEARDVAAHIRSTSRPDTYWAVYPRMTMPVSVTGRACALNCAHCGGHYLKNMVDIRDFDREFSKRMPTSVLLSGGCNDGGAVPLASWCRILHDRGIRMNVHPGVTSTENALIIGRNSDVISFDFIMDDQTIQTALNGRWTKSEYVRTFNDLRRGTARVVPHILVGLMEGKVRGEVEAIDFLANEGVERIIFIVFIPTPGTRWSHLSPPPKEDVARLVYYTRVLKPDVDLIVGCMRPGGAYRRELDRLLFEVVDGTVLPHPEALKAAESRGRIVLTKEECCAF